VAWVGGITLAVVQFLALSNETGWAIAGGLGLSTLAAVTFILFELRNAMELPDDVDPVDYLNRPVPSGWKSSVGSPPVAVHAAPAFRIKS
jgi:hypothetical protein